MTFDRAMDFLLEDDPVQREGWPKCEFLLFLPGVEAREVGKLPAISKLRFNKMAGLL